MRWVAILLLLVIEVITVSLLYYNREQKEHQILDRSLDRLKLSFDAALQIRTMAVHTAVEDAVLRNDVLSTFWAGQLKNEPGETEGFRLKLYRYMLPVYERLVNEGFEELHFHGVDGSSYLRMSRPQQHGDALASTRPTVARVVSTGQEASGFEVAVLGPGYNVVHPIMFEGKRIGSVGSHISTLSLQQTLLSLVPEAEYGFVWHHDALKSIDGSGREFFQNTQLSRHYVQDSLLGGDMKHLHKANQSGIMQGMMALLARHEKTQKKLNELKPISTYQRLESRWYSVVMLPFTDVNGQHMGYVTSVTPSNEITEIIREFWISTLASSVFVLLMLLLLWRAQKQAQVNSEQQARLQTITNTMADGLYVLDAKGVMTFINPAGLKLLGYAESDLLQHRPVDLVYVDDEGNRGLSPSLCPLCKVLRTGEPFRGEWRFIRRDDVIFPVEVSSQPLLEGEKVVGSVTVFRDVSERKKTEKALEQAREMAEQASASKSAFLANMSHEIRTPMNGVLGMATLLQDTELNSEQRDYLRTISTSGDALLTIIDDILDYSKIEAGMMTIEHAPIDLRQLFEDVHRLLLTRAKDKGIILSAQVADVVPHRVMGDSVRLRQILINLMGNAIKFTEHGRVDVFALLLQQEADNLQLRIEVKDTGIGIPADKIGRLFKSFSQVDESTTRQFGGTGLGLSISKRLAELMGGEMGVSSVEGEGSTFWFTVMLGVAPQEANESVVVIGVDGEVMPAGRLLLVEDNPVNQKVALAMLAKLGYKPDVANNGQEALAFLQEHDYDLVLMDCQMPILDGFAATRAVRSGLTSNPHTIIVALTANAMKEDQDACYAAGMNDYLSKPIQMPLLKAMLLKHLTARQTA